MLHIRSTIIRQNTDRTANIYAILCLFLFLLCSSFLVPFLLSLFIMVTLSYLFPLGPSSRSLRSSWRLSQSSPTLKPQRHYITLPMPSFCASKMRLPTIGPARITHKAGNWPRPDSHTLQNLHVNDSLYLLLSKTRIST